MMRNKVTVVCGLIQMVELRRECEQLQQELERSRDQFRLLVEAEKRAATAAKDKLLAQMAQMKSANEQVNLSTLFINRLNLSTQSEHTQNLPPLLFGQLHIAK